MIKAWEDYINEEGDCAVHPMYAAAFTAGWQAGIYKIPAKSRAWPERTVAVLNNGDSVIVVDDHCYAMKNWNGYKWGWSAFVFREAVTALKALPDNPDDAVTVVTNDA